MPSERKSDRSLGQTDIRCATAKISWNRASAFDSLFRCYKGVSGQFKTARQSPSRARSILIPYGGRRKNIEEGLASRNRLIGVTIAGAYRQLRRKLIICSQFLGRDVTPAKAWASLALYNTFEDLDALARVVRQLSIQK